MATLVFDIHSAGHRA